MIQIILASATFAAKISNRSKTRPQWKLKRKLRQSLRKNLLMQNRCLIPKREIIMKKEKWMLTRKYLKNNKCQAKKLRSWKSSVKIWSSNLFQKTKFLKFWPKDSKKSKMVNYWQNRQYWGVILLLKSKIKWKIWLENWPSESHRREIWLKQEVNWIKFSKNALKWKIWPNLKSLNYNRKSTLRPKKSKDCKVIFSKPNKLSKTLLITLKIKIHRLLNSLKVRINASILAFPSNLHWWNL